MDGTLTADLRYALRGLLARPVFTLVAIASLALGIGANTAIFSLFEQVALRELGVEQPGQLVNFHSPGIKRGSTSYGSIGGRDEIFSHPMLRDLQREMPPQLQGIVGHSALEAAIGLHGETRLADAGMVSGNYFDVLRLVPHLGRLLSAADDQPGSTARVAVLSYDHWRNLHGSDPAVLGQQLHVNGVALTIVGVAPEGFRGTAPGRPLELFVPLTLSEVLQPRMNHEVDDRNSHWVHLFGRLAEGATREQADAALDLPYQRQLREHEAPLHADLGATRMQEFLAREVVLSPGARGQSRTAQTNARPLAMLQAVAALVLLIACLNIANLLLARGTARAVEFAVRASIGASRLRLVRQLLVEAALLAVGGAVLGLLLAAVIKAGLMYWLGEAASGMDPGLDAAAVGFAALAMVATLLLFGLFPALQIARVAPIAALRGGAQTSARGGNRLRTMLAVSQVAFSMVSLVLAGLFARSLSNLAAEELGMQVQSLAVFTVAPERLGYDGEHAQRLFGEIERELAAVHGVTAVAASLVPLLSNNTWGTNVSVEGYESTPESPSPGYSMVGPGFFATMGTALLAGREFSLADNAGAPRVAVVNTRFAEAFGIGPNPVGRRMATGGQDELDIEIVGVIGDTKYSSVKDEVTPLFFLPWRQHGSGQMSFYVRGAVPAEALLAQIPPLIARIDPQLPVEGLRTVPQQIALTLGMDRFVGLLSVAFAVLSTLLAALGLYGVLSYTLAQRLPELGLRLALGAQPARVARGVLRQVARMTLVGGTLGLGAALLLGRAAESMLFGLHGNQPSVLLAAAAVLALVALLAGALPARRAARIDPMTALRHQ